MTVRQIMAIEPPPWLIEGLLPQWPMGNIFAPSGAGKSFIALDWALSIASGVPWLGRATLQAPALYMVGEGNYGTQNRISAWLNEKGKGVEDLRGFHGLDGVVKHPAVLLIVVR
jgi:hypothetical protein